MFVREPSYDEVGYCAERVAGYCERLDLGVGLVADCFDDCGEEGAEAWGLLDCVFFVWE